MKVVILNTMYAPLAFGGAEVGTQLLAEELVRQGHDVSVVAAVPGKDGTRTVEGVRVHEVGLRNVYWPFGSTGSPGLLKPLWHLLDIRNPWMTARVRRVLEAEAPDVVHTNNVVGFSTAVWGAAQERGVPVVHTLHDYALLCVRAMLFRRGRACGERCLECRVFSRPKRRGTDAVDVVVGVGRYILERHQAEGFFLRARGEVVPVPIVGPRDEGVRRRGDGLLQLGYLGRLHPGKGVGRLLEAVSTLPSGRWELQVAGAGTVEYEEELRRRYEGPGIRFLGRVDPASFLRGVDVLVVPSRWHEGSPRVIPEAYAYGVPVLGSTRGGVPELVEEGVTGFVFDPDAPEELEGLVRRLLENPEDLFSMREACLERARPHSPRAVADRYVECYERAIHDGR